MTTQPPGFSVLSTPVALCDRRALSEAWYSALHIHKQAASEIASRRRCSGASASAPPASLCSAKAGAKGPVALTMAVRIGAALALPGAPVSERRSLRTKLAQKIEQVFLKPEHPPSHASFALDGAYGRVQILLQQCGGRMQIVALCPPGARDVVAQALSQARYALSLRGLNLQTDIRGFAR